jgi:2-keto-3-deoxy-L-rhamnonate aldolase RhmA
MTFLTMKNPLRVKLAERERSTYGAWVTLEDPTVTEAMVELGVDWIVVDMEHGGLSYKDVVAHARAARGSNVAVLTRLPATTVDSVKRALDLGIDGVILPLIRCAAELEEGMQFARYPNRGLRGVGGERAVHWGLRLQEYLDIANRETMVIPLIETRGASEDITNILQVDGIEAIFLGPADLSASFGHLGQWEGPGVADEILRIVSLAEAHNVVAGVIGRDEEDTERRAKQGFRMIGLGSDIVFMTRTVKALLERIRSV